MRFADLVQMSLTSLRQRLFRTSLTVLGVVIGTTAVVVMVSLGVGMSQSMMDSITDNSSLRRVTVSPGMTKEGKEKRLDTRAMDDIKALPNVAVVNPTYAVGAQLRAGRYQGYANIVGHTRASLESMKLTFSEGGLPNSGPLAVAIGSQTSIMMSDSRGQMPDPEFNLMHQSMFVTFDSSMGAPAGDGGNPAPAKKILVPVSGTIAQSASGWSQHDYQMYADIDSLIAALKRLNPGKALPGQPATATGAPTGQFTYTSFEVDAVSMDDAEQLAADIRDMGFNASSNMEYIKEMQRQSMMIQAVFGGIGFISLLVAAIGIANTMMMSVYERTREIGIMKVLGAALSDIRKMFLIESASIGLLGGAVGVLLSLLISVGMNATLGQMMAGGFGGSSMKVSVIPLWLIALAMGFSMAIGTLAGLAPAQRAMRLSPLSAIRAE